jgi:hypothetical protein
MTSRLSFELSLLGQMSETYQASVLREIGLTEAEAIEIRRRSPLKVPEQLDSALEAYADLLGLEVKSEPLGHSVPEPFAGSTAHSFSLMLWPHLYWVVNRRPDGRSWGASFQNQAPIGFAQMDGAMVRVGLWTRMALERVAEHHELYDGWDDYVVIRFVLGGRRCEGTFVFGLLQEWRKL